MSNATYEGPPLDGTDQPITERPELDDLDREAESIVYATEPDAEGEEQTVLVDTDELTPKQTEIVEMHMTMADTASYKDVYDALQDRGVDVSHGYVCDTLRDVHGRQRHANPDGYDDLTPKRQAAIDFWLQHDPEDNSHPSTTAAAEEWADTHDMGVSTIFNTKTNHGDILESMSEDNTEDDRNDQPPEADDESEAEHSEHLPDDLTQDAGDTLQLMTENLELSHELTHAARVLEHLMDRDVITPREAFGELAQLAARGGINQDRLEVLTR